VTPLRVWAFLQDGATSGRGDVASLKKRGRFFSVQFWWDGKQYIKPLRLEDETEALRIKGNVEAAIDGLKHGRFPRASRLLDEGYDIRDIIFPNETTAHLLDGDVAADDGKAYAFLEDGASIVCGKEMPHMVSRTQIQALVKWAGAGMCISIVVCALISTRRFICWTGSHHQVYLQCGAMGFGWRADGSCPGMEQPSFARGWVVCEYGAAPPKLGQLIWWFQRNSGAWEGGAIPLWLPFLLTGGPTVYCWWRGRSPLPGYCARCRYNLTANVSGLCPECGTPIEQERRVVESST